MAIFNCNLFPTTNAALAELLLPFIGFTSISCSQSHKTKQFASSTLHSHLISSHPSGAFPGSLSLSLIPSQFIFMQQIAIHFPSSSSSWGFAVICVLYFCRWSKAKLSSEALKTF